MLENSELMKSDLNQQEIKNEFDLKIAEHVLKLEEFKAKLQSERKNVWFTSPLLITLLTAFFGLMGTAIGAVLQGYWNVEVERQQFESNLIIKLLEGTADEKQRAKNLLFLLDAGLVSTLDERKIRELADDPGRLPIILPSVTLTVREAKALLRAYGFYNGEINDAADNALRDAIIKFQESQGFAIDGLLGPMTAEALINFVPQQAK